MDKQALIAKLNWFYSLEVTQVEHYMIQSKYYKDEEAALAMEHFSKVEQQHVDNISAQIRGLGAEPSKVGGIAAPALGLVGGNILALSGIDNALKINIKIEEMAVADYQDLIDILKPEGYNEELVKILQYNLLDEQLHILWFKNKLEERKSASIQNNYQGSE